MEAAAKGVVRPDLKTLVREASQALARLDAERLAELTQACEALNRELGPAISPTVVLDLNARESLSREAREAVAEMAVLGRVLEATQANIRAMNRLRELRVGRIEYSERQVRGWAAGEDGHGNH